MNLLVVRHGQTQWNAINCINGQGNSPLTKVGVEESTLCGKSLRQMHFDRVLVSDLGRTVETLQCMGLEGEFEDRLRDRNFGPYNGQFYGVYAKAKVEECQRLSKGTDKISDVSYSGSRSSCVLTYDANSTNGQTTAQKHKQTNGHANGRDDMWLDNPFYKVMLTEIEPAGVERYQNLFIRIADLIQDITHRVSCQSTAKSANVLFVTHCSPVRMCAMVLSSLSADEFPCDLRKCDIPNNSITEFRITADRTTHHIDKVELVKLASTKHLFET